MILEDSENKVTQNTTMNTEDKINSSLKNDILTYVARSNAVFKSQQKDEPELTFEEKFVIATNLLEKSPCLFLAKFGNHLREEHLRYFETAKPDDYEISYHINRLKRYLNNSIRQKDVKNRRYQALKNLIEKGDYFSECEMMKRNPLLYEHLIGQYLTEKQKKERDNIDSKNITFVNILMETMERNGMNELRKQQEDQENDIAEESDSDDDSDGTYTYNNTNWTSEGETSTEGNTDKNRSKMYNPPYRISGKEQQLLKQEFLTIMYQNFLEGKDLDFDYSTVDNNEAYDNLELRTQDEEEKYFDSESPGIIATENGDNVNSINESLQTESEDELDIYMKSLKEQISPKTYSLENKR